MASLLNMRGGSLLEKGLPYDAEIEYLGLDNTQYYRIATEITYKRNIGFGCVVSHYESSLNTAGSGYPILMGTVDASPNRSAFYTKGTNSSGSNSLGRVNLDWQSGFTQLNIYMGGENKQKLELKAFSTNKMRVYLDDVFIKEFNSFNPTATATSVIRLLGTNYLYKGRIYRFFVYDTDNSYLFDGIPVRVGTTGYMYDRVSKQLFGNTGTGDFILGNDI